MTSTGAFARQLASYGVTGIPLPSVPDSVARRALRTGIGEVVPADSAMGLLTKKWTKEPLGEEISDLSSIPDPDEYVLRLKTAHWGEYVLRGEEPTRAACLIVSALMIVPGPGLTLGDLEAIKGVGRRGAIGALRRLVGREVVKEETGIDGQKLYRYREEDVPREGAAVASSEMSGLGSETSGLSSETSSDLGVESESSGLGADVILNSGKGHASTNTSPSGTSNGKRDTSSNGSSTNRILANTGSANPMEDTPVKLSRPEEIARAVASLNKPTRLSDLADAFGMATESELVTILEGLQKRLKFGYAMDTSSQLILIPESTSDGERLSLISDIINSRRVLILSEYATLFSSIHPGLSFTPSGSGLLAIEQEGHRLIEVQSKYSATECIVCATEKDQESELFKGAYEKCVEKIAYGFRGKIKKYLYTGPAYCAQDAGYESDPYKQASLLYECISRHVSSNGPFLLDQESLLDCLTLGALAGCVKLTNSSLRHRRLLIEIAMALGVGPGEEPDDDESVEYVDWWTGCVRAVSGIGVRDALEGCKEAGLDEAVMLVRGGCVPREFQSIISKMVRRGIMREAEDEMYWYYELLKEPDPADWKGTTNKRDIPSIPLEERLDLFRRLEDCAPGEFTKRFKEEVKGVKEPDIREWLLKRARNFK